MAKLNLALRPDEIRRIAEGLGREPTTVELYAFDAQWSEHCSYKSSRHLLKKLPVSGPNVVVGPGEDAGVVYLGEHEGERYCVVVAHESHNHPSQVVPFEGAATGVGGIVRDVLCMGAEVIGLADCLRFGNVDDPQSHQRYVARQVVDGIAAYGNAIGVPNIAGDVYFHEGFNDNCLVNVIALGLVKEKDIIHSRAPTGSAGWDIVLVGKATDASGFGGASFSSLTLEEANQEANKSAVQVPDPFLKNVIMRASYRVFEYLREKKITAGFKDLGAGGIMGCTAELCAAGGYGAIIDLDDVNAAVENLPPEVIAVGETQERLCWVLPGEATADVLRIYNEEFSLPEIARSARAVVIGAVQEEKRYVMRHGDETVMDVPIEFLTEAIKQDLPHVEWPTRERSSEDLFAPLSPEDDVRDIFETILSHKSVASAEPIYREYDAVVRGATVIARGTAGAGVIAPIPGSPLGVALAVAGNPRYGAVDPRRAAELAVCEAVQRVVSVGAEPVALTDCLNFGNPNDAKQYGQIAAAIDGLSNAAQAFQLPLVSGNVSLYNESSVGRSIPASAIVSCVGRVADVSSVVTRSLKYAGSELYLIGYPQSAIGGSVMGNVLGVEDVLPSLDLKMQPCLTQFVLAAMRSGIVRSCAVVSDGGLLAAASALAIGASREGRSLGARFEHSCESFSGTSVSHYDHFFSEPGGLILEVDGGAFARLLKAEAIAGSPFWEGYVNRIGLVTPQPEIVADEEHFSISDLRAAWSRPMVEIYA